MYVYNHLIYIDWIDIEHAEIASNVHMNCIIYGWLKHKTQSHLKIIVCWNYVSKYVDLLGYKRSCSVFLMSKNSQEGTKTLGNYIGGNLSECFFT